MAEIKKLNMSFYNVDAVKNRINDLEEQILKIDEFDRKVVARNFWRRKNSKTYGRWNK